MMADPPVPFPERPLRIGVTLGDPSGIGPEVTVKALERLAERDWTPVLLGDPEILEFARGAANADFEFAVLESEAALAELTAPAPALLPVESPVKVGELVLGEVSAACGEAAFRAIREGIRLCRSGLLDGLCTAPISKAALHQAGHLFPGHTEILKTFTQTRQVAMCMVGGGLRTVPLTGHLPLRQALGRITEDAIWSMLQLLNQELRLFGVERPRIAVTGLNPHAGEGGALGSEDETIIRPAIERAQNKNLPVEGPVPADVAFYQMRQGRYDVVLAMYHDQALIPIKTLAFDEGVNVTLGLPFIRTSPDHGTAHEIAGRNQADPKSMLAALNLARTLIENKLVLD